MTDLISPTLPWHQSLEQWCAEHIGHSRQAVPTQAQFAPFEAHKPEKFHQVAVVLVVLTSATRHVHRGFAEAAELIRASTSGSAPCWSPTCTGPRLLRSATGRWSSCWPKRPGRPTGRATG